MSEINGTVVPVDVSAGHHPEPVFILAPARSYSTIALALLAGHPRIYGFPELLLCSCATAGELLSERQRRPKFSDSVVRIRRGGPLRAIAHLHEGTQDEQALRHAESWLKDHSDWDTMRLLDHLLDLASPLIGLEKSPETVHTDDGLARLMAAYPKARYIHLTRHPVTSMRSLRENHRNLLAGVAEIKIVAASASAWYCGHERIVDALSKIPVHQWMRIRSEDLLRAPEVWLPRILGWLGLEYDGDIVARMLQTERWQFAGPGDVGWLGGGDPKFMRAPALRPIPDPGPIIFDPELGLLDEMQRRMKELARYLGYDG